MSRLRVALLVLGLALFGGVAAKGLYDLRDDVRASRAHLAEMESKLGEVRQKLDDIDSELQEIHGTLLGDADADGDESPKATKTRAQAAARIAVRSQPVASRLTSVRRQRSSIGSPRLPTSSRTPKPMAPRLLIRSR